MERDIFEDMRAKELFNLSLDQYSEKQVFEFCEYVYGKNNLVYKSLKDKTNK